MLEDPFLSLPVSVKVINDQQPVLVGRQRQPARDTSSYQIRLDDARLEILCYSRCKLILRDLRYNNHK